MARRPVILTADGEQVADGMHEAAEIKALERQVRYSPSPSLAVDGVLVKDSEVLLIRRKSSPHEGEFALPGGFVQLGETVVNAVLRELKEETAIDARIVRLVGVYSDPKRDPRGHTVSVAFLLEYVAGSPQGGDDASEARFFPLDELPDLAFDHGKILADTIRLMD
jgi:8-oxo-dGTP diphosphatase